MNFYIKVINNLPTDHPVTEDNLKLVFGTDTLSEELLQSNNYYKFEDKPSKANVVIESEDGYELCVDNVVRKKQTTRELTQEEKIDLWVRRGRNHLLLVSDWSQIPDVSLSAEKKAEWAAYRQQLRDLTSVYAEIESPEEVVFPTAPTN